MSPLSVMTLVFVALLFCSAVGLVLRRVGGPTTVLEIAVGFIIGNWLLSDAEIANFRGIAELGTIILFFFVGLTIRRSTLQGVSHHLVRVVPIGAMMPVMVMLILYPWLGLELPEFALATAVVMTSGAGIAARVLKESGYLESPSGRLLLTTSVIDDIPSVLALSLAMAYAVGGGLIQAVLVPLVVLVFLFFALSQISRITLLARVSPLFPLGVAVVAAWITAQAGLSALAGAFMSGLMLGGLFREKDTEYIQALLDLCVPIFFIFVGTLIPFEVLTNRESWMTAGLISLATVLTPWPVALVLGKRAKQEGIDRWLVASGMLSRGLPGLAFATIAFTAELIPVSLFSALVIAVSLTNVVGPIFMTLRMNWLTRRDKNSATRLR
ncbi:MAG: cation:proton antiporter [Moraxellaceae bacterium]|nr:cation:proton antiporter [Moraxellaceae bacterium]MDZ4387571.1 cation:proton antiporter [Moraxellaceae bacterium]